MRTLDQSLEGEFCVNFSQDHTSIGAGGVRDISNIEGATISSHRVSFSVFR